MKQNLATDYTQSGEQQMILDWMSRRGDRRPGRFLDVGAVDGVTMSNSRALAERGWGGVCVEPAAWAFDRLATLYADRPDVECVQVALTAGAPTSLIRFHYAHDLVSTTEQENADVWAELASFMPCYVAAVDVTDLLEVLPGPYDFVTVDTEGTSLELVGELLHHGALAEGGLLCVECEDGGERWLAQQWCLTGLARVGVTPNNLLLERIA